MSNRVPDERLVAHLRKALLPQRFPARREVELEGGVSDGANAICFYDHCWPAPSVLAVWTVRLVGGDLDSALRAAGLKQLLRALVATTRSAPAVLEGLAAHSAAANLDLALLVLDVAAGTLSSGATGRAAADVLSPIGAHEGAAPGDLLWLVAGDAAIPAASTVPPEGIGALVSEAIERGRPAAVCALLVKGRGRKALEATFSIGNTHGDIHVAGEKVRHFLEMHGASEEDIAGIDVALDEILTNAVNYGFADGHAHEILLSLSMAPELLTIEVRDDGNPFDPLGIPPPDLDADLEARQIGGLGMHFVRMLLDTVSYSRRNGWNVLKLEKRLSTQTEKVP